MAEKIKKHKDIVFVLGVSFVLMAAAIIGMLGVVALPGSVSASISVPREVEVTATIETWLTFTVNETAITLTPYMVAIGGATAIASSSDITLNVGTNDTGGWIVTIMGTSTQNGLKLEGGATVIASVPAATSTELSAGTDGYGTQAESTYGATTTVHNNYNTYGTDYVGPIRQAAAVELARSANPHEAVNIAKMKVMAASESTNPPGSYKDIITLTATAPIP